MLTKKQRICGIGIVGILILWLLSVATVIVIQARFLYKIMINGLSLSKRTGLSNQVIDKNYDQVINYLTLPWDAHLKTSNFVISNMGRQHFAEVKGMFIGVFILAIFLTIVAISFLYWYFKIKSGWQLLRPLSYGFVIILIIGIFITLTFNSTFITFHQVVFPDNTWQFNLISDPIIKIFPEEMFEVYFLIIIGLVLLGLVGLWGWIFKHYKK